MTLFNFPVIIFALILTSAQWAYAEELSESDSKSDLTGKSIDGENEKGTPKESSIESQEDDGLEGMVDEFMKEFLDENSDYVWMVERRGCFCFLNESSQIFRIFAAFIREHFYSYLPFKRCVLSKINYTHSAFADLGKDLVMGNGCVWFKAHFAIRITIVKGYAYDCRKVD